MKRKLNYKEAEHVYRTAFSMLGGPCPIKSPIRNTLKELEDSVEKYLKGMDALILEHAVLDDKGEPLKNPPEIQQQTRFPFQMSTPDEFLLAQEELDSTEIEIEFSRSPQESLVIVGGNTFKLKEYLEATVDLPAKLAIFLLEYFVDES